MKVFLGVSALTYGLNCLLNSNSKKIHETVRSNKRIESSIIIINGLGLA